MKTKFLSAAFLLVSTLTFAQSGAVTNAILYQESGELDKAKSEIDRAAVHEKTSLAAKTWYNKGFIYESLVVSEKPEYQKLCDSAAAVSFNSYQKSISLDKPNGQYAKLSKERLNNLYIVLLNDGITKYQKKDYYNALGSFKMAQKIKLQDTTAYIYGAYAAEELGDKKTAVEQFNQLKSIGYTGLQMYVYVIDYYSKVEKDDTKVGEALQEGRAKYPQNKNLIFAEMEYLLKNGRKEEALQKAEQAIKADPKNGLLYFSIGVLYDQTGQQDKAIESYLKSVELDPNYFDALFNLGADYYTSAGELVKKKGNMSMKEYNEKGKALDAEINTRFNQSMTYLEKAYAINKNDEQVKQVLRDIYKRLSLTEKLKTLE